MILPQLLVCENFIPRNEVEVLYHYMRDEAEWTQPEHADFTERQHWQLLATEAPPHVDPIIKKFRVNKKAALENFFGETLVQTRRMSFRKWVPGDYQSAHSDIGRPDGEVMFTQRHSSLSLHHNDFATVTYLNGDFEGGEIYFEHYGVQIIPRPGLMIAFPSSHQYMHGVKPVISGNRYVITSFWPRARTLVHNLLPSVPTGWFYDVENVGEVMDMISPQDIERIPEELRPPKEVYGGFVPPQ
jgi:hypothetical protein